MSGPHVVAVKRNATSAGGDEAVCRTCGWASWQESDTRAREVADRHRLTQPVIPARNEATR